MTSILSFHNEIIFSILRMSFNELMANPNWEYVVLTDVQARRRLREIYLINHELGCPKLKCTTKQLYVLFVTSNDDDAGWASDDSVKSSRSI